MYLVAIHRANDYNPEIAEDATVHEDIHAINREMVDKNVRIFVAGLRPYTEAKSIRRSECDEPIVTDGPYLEAKEHVGGFWVLEAADIDEAVEWGRKASAACRANVEVRELHSRPSK